MNKKFWTGALFGAGTVVAGYLVATKTEIGKKAVNSVVDCYEKGKRLIIKKEVEEELINDLEEQIENIL